MKTKLFIVAFLISVLSWGQMTFTSGAGLVQSQNFDGLPTNNTSNTLASSRLGQEWYRNTATTQTQILSGNIIVGQNTTSTAHGMYNCGASSSSTDRAVGAVATGTAQHSLGGKIGK